MSAEHAVVASMIYFCQFPVLPLAEKKANDALAFENRLSFAGGQKQATESG